MKLTTARYTDQIAEIMGDLEKLCGKLKSGGEPDALDQCIKEYLETIKVVKFITEWNEFDDSLGGLDDMGFEREDLVRVADRIAAKEREIIEAGLNSIDYRLSSAAMLAPVTQQAAFRIEQVRTWC
jgi:hypothetical protein